MTTFHVDASVLDDSVAHITRTIDSLTADIAGLSAQLRTLDASWSGPAALAFATVIDDWTASSGRTTETLTSIGAALRQIHASYIDTEETNVRLLGR